MRIIDYHYDFHSHCIHVHLPFEMIHNYPDIYFIEGCSSKQIPIQVKLNISLFHFNTLIPHIIPPGNNWYFVIYWAVYQCHGGLQEYEQLHWALILLYISSPCIVNMKSYQEFVKQMELSINWYIPWIYHIDYIITWCAECMWYIDLWDKNTTHVSPKNWNGNGDYIMS